MQDNPKSKEEVLDMKQPDLEPESVRLAMDQAWRDHQHTRDQTWKALQMEFVLAAGLVGVTLPIQEEAVRIAAGILILAAAACGIQITLRHRNRVELRKFRHILQCEQFLQLHAKIRIRVDVDAKTKFLPLIDNVRMPRGICFWDAFCPLKGNTALFILRMHIAIYTFGLAYAAWHIHHVIGCWRWAGYGVLASIVVAGIFTMFTGESVRPEKSDKEEPNCS